MTKQKRKYILYIALLLIFSSVAVYFVLKDDAESIWESLINAKWYYILLGFGLTAISYFLNALLLTLLTRIYKKDYKVRQGLAIYLIGCFFSGITPSSTGGQFGQAYTYNKQKVKVTNAASILFMAFIIHQIMAIVFSIITFLSKFNAMTKMTASFQFWGINFNIIALSLVGFVINFFILFILFVCAFSKKLHFGLVHGTFNLLGKLHFMKKDKVELRKKNMDEKVATFRIELKRLLTNWKVLSITSLLSLIDIIVRSFYPYVMCLAIGVPNIASKWFDAVCLTNFTNLITMMIPLPGAAGGAELVFQFMFQQFIGSGQQYVSTVNLLWRLYSFYINVIVGAIVFIFYRGSSKESVMDLEIQSMSSIVVLTLTQEINIELEKFKEVDENKKRKKYRPKLLDDEENNQVEEINAEKNKNVNNKEDVVEHFSKVKEDLMEQLEKNENEFKNENIGEQE